MRTATPLQVTLPIVLLSFLAGAFLAGLPSAAHADSVTFVLRDLVFHGPAGSTGVEEVLPAAASLSAPSPSPFRERTEPFDEAGGASEIISGVEHHTEPASTQIDLRPVVELRGRVLTVHEDFDS
jgi:hypothetical protein